MSGYSTYYDGEYIDVADLEECLKSIRCRNEDNERRIEYLKEENRKLREEYDKDEEIQRMKLELDKMSEDYYRGFPIAETEQDSIKKWKKKHDEDVHGLMTNKMRLKAEGCCGGRYIYKFIPTSIGISGKIVCNCGAEFEFKEIG